MKYCDTTKLSIRPVTKNRAKMMVIKYHYSKLWTKCSVALGLFHQTGREHAFFDEPEEKMVGVIVYGDPIGRLTGQSISDKIKRTEVLELTRLFIHDGYGSNIESWFISQSFKWLRKHKPEIKDGLIQMLISLDEYGCEDLKHYDKVVDSACILISQN